MAPYIEYIFPTQIGVELIYSFVIIVCSLMIYYATKEVYELSSYKGIKYFRQAFLFFALAFFFRYSIRFLLFLFNLEEVIEFAPRLLGAVTLFILLYSSSIAVFYLLYSVMWKRWNHSKMKLAILHMSAILIGLIGLLFRTIQMFLLINLVLFAFISFILFIAYKDSKNKSKGKNLYIIYLLLFIFWILNIIDILIPRFFQVYQIIIYLISILIFMTILYKVVKKSGN